MHVLETSHGGGGRHKICSCERMSDMQYPFHFSPHRTGRLDCKWSTLSKQNVKKKTFTEMTQDEGVLRAETVALG